MANFKGNKSINLSAQEKKKLLKHILKKMIFLKLAKKYKISYSAVKKWCLNYEIYGVAALQSQTDKMNYKQKVKSKPSSKNTWSKW